VANGIWTAGAAPDLSFDTLANWLDNIKATTGGTITIASATAPASAKPAAGTFNFTVSGNYAVRLGDWLGGAAIQHVQVSHPGAQVTVGQNITGGIYVPAGLAVLDNESVATASAIGTDAGTLRVNSGTVTFGDVLTVGAGGTLEIESGATIDVTAAGMQIAGTTGAIANSGTILGCVDGQLDASVCTWTGTGTIRCTVAGTLDLCTDVANSQSIDIQPAAGAVVIGDDFTCYGFLQTSGNLTMGGHTITLGAGGLDYVAIGTHTTPGTFVFDENTAVAKWASYTGAMAALRVKTGKTVILSGYLYTKTIPSVAGYAGTIVPGAGSLRLYPGDDNFWTGAPTVSGTGRVIIFAIGTAWSNAAAITLANTVTFEVAVASAAERIITLAGGLTCGPVIVRGNYNATHISKLSMTGPLNCTTLTLGSASNDTGRVALSAGQTHTIAGAVAKRGTSTAHQLTFGGTCLLGGNVTLAGITPDFGSAYIYATGDITIDGASAGTISNTGGYIFANGHTVTIQNLAYTTTAAPLICVGCTEPAGGSNGAGVVFQQPQRCMTGCGI